MSEYPQRLEQALASAGLVFATTWAFTVGPTLRFTDPAYMAMFGLFFAMGLAMVWLNCRLGKFDRDLILWVVFAVCGFCGLAWQMIEGINRQSTIHEVCHAIASEMLNRPDVREADAAAFQALGCPYSVQAGDTFLPSPPAKRS